jgi:YD repeat-containing protein
MYGQQPDYVTQGLALYNSYDGGNIDHVNVKNGKVVLRIPLVSFPQRGKLKLSFSLVGRNVGYAYSGKTCDLSGWCTESYYRYQPFGWSLSNPISPFLMMDQDLHLTITSVQQPNNGFYWSELFNLTDSTGAQHPLGFDNNNLTNIRATDGSGYLITTSGGNAYDANQLSKVSYTAYSSDGLRYGYPIGSGQLGGTSASSISDSDGNTVSAGSSGWTDSLGRTIPAVPAMSSSIVGCPILNLPYESLVGSATWSVPGPNGASQTFLFCYTSVTYRTHVFGSCSVNFCYETTGAENAIQSIVLPNGTYWTFGYDAANPSDKTSIAYGDLIQVSLPTGGTINYKYTNWGSSSNPGNSNRNLSQRTVAAGDGTQYTWQYTLGSGPAVTSTDPLGNDTVYAFSTPQSNSTCNFYLNANETSRTMYAGSQTTGKLLRTITTAYQYSVNPQQGTFQSWPYCATPLPTSSVTTLDNGLKSSTTYAYNDGGFVNTQPICSVYNGSSTCTIAPSTPAQTPFGRVTSTSVTDYTGSTLGTINTQYLQQVNSSYKTVNFLNLVATATILNGSNVQVGKTSYGYDENNGSPQGVYGHQTSISKWLNTSSSIVPCNGTTAGSNVATCTIFNAQGMANQTTDPNGNVTKYTYDATGAFLGQIQYPDTTYNGSTVHHTVGLSFDANTGLQLSSTDQKY